MNRFAWPFIILTAIVAGCNRASDSARIAGPELLAETSVPGMSKYALAQPIHVSNVSIVPVISEESQKMVGPEYATLAEAKKNAWIEIIEKPGDEEVNELEVHNVGPKPILLLSGDLLLGGKQDRVVAKDTIVPPNATVRVPVYCVEPGRWSGDSEKFTYGDTTVPMMVKKEAAFGNQEQVWAEVGRFNDSAGLSRGGRTTVQEGLSQKDVQAAIASNLEAVRGKLGSNVVGLIFLVAGEVRTMEIFGNHRLFSASCDSLLKGALAQAAIAKDAPNAKVDLDSCARFMSEAMRSNRVVEGRAHGTVNARRASPASKGMELHFSDDEAKESGLVHGTYTKQ